MIGSQGTAYISSGLVSASQCVRRFWRAKKAFTLVELLIVVGIIGLLATIGVTAFGSAKINARNMQRKANLTQMAKALELYANDHGGLYPTTGGAAAWHGACNYGSWGPYSDTYVDSTHDAWIPGLTPTYMSVLPHDIYTNASNPNSPNSSCGTTPIQNCYLYTSNGTDYKILARCLPEGTWTASDPFYETNRSNYSWSVYSPGAKNW